ncbi:lipocalin family protein [Niveibacterium sp. SC-1]|uniref:lipocalin family protein n=1 Tax=Niveibacterium sp. SC-1 TaxID=3135646 RepID=UPI00311E6F1E
MLAFLLRNAFNMMLFCLLLASSVSWAAPPATVSQVDLARYLGKWFEIGHLPMFFQRQCVANTSAEYVKREDGRLGVINRCETKDGKYDESVGQASVVEGTGNAQLKVSFFWPFRGDYWVIGLDPDYRWALVASPDRDHLWLLSRSRNLPQADSEKALAIAREQGFKLDQWSATPQTE